MPTIPDDVTYWSQMCRGRELGFAEQGLNLLFFASGIWSLACKNLVYAGAEGEQIRFDGIQVAAVATMARRHHDSELRPIQGRATKVGYLRVQCAIQENVVASEVPVDNLLGMNEGERMGDLLAPSKSLLKTNNAFVLLKIWK